MQIGRVNVVVLFIFISMSSVLAFRQLGHSYRHVLGVYRQRSVLPVAKSVFSLMSNPIAKHKPDFSKELNEKYFEYNRLEKSLYCWWEENGMFKADHTGGNSCKIMKIPFIVNLLLHFLHHLQQPRRPERNHL